MARGRVGAFVPAFHDDVGLRIDRVARLHQAAEDFGVVAIREQRPVVAAGDAAHEGR